MWDLPGPGLEPVSPALAGGFLTTVPPGKPNFLILEGSKIGQKREENSPQRDPWHFALFLGDSEPPADCERVASPTAAEHSTFGHLAGEPMAVPVRQPCYHILRWLVLLGPLRVL